MFINRLTLESSHLTKKQFFITVFLLYSFSVFIRIVWLLLSNDISGYTYQNDIFLLTTPDGYFSATGARDLLAGFSQPYDHSPVGTLISQLSALLTYILPFRLDTVIFFLPAFLSALIVFPIALTFRLHRLDILGLSAALLSSISFAYFSRTTAGYFDTDMLAVVLPLCIIYALNGAYFLQNKKLYYVLGFVFSLFSYSWYAQSTAVIVAILGFAFLYSLFKKDAVYIFQKPLLFILIGILPTALFYKLLLFFTVYLTIQKLKMQVFYIISLVIAALFIYLGGLDFILLKLQSYFFKHDGLSGQNSGSLHFYALLNTVEEARSLALYDFANEVSGNIIIFILSSAGIILAMLRYRFMLLFSPFLLLGLLSFKTGIRFSMYAPVVFSLGGSFFILFVMQTISQHFSLKPLIKNLSVILLIFTFLLPSLSHALLYKPYPSIEPAQAQILSDLKTMTGREDYILSWWDNGYFIEYFSDTKTLTNGGRNYGSENFPIAYALIHSQKLSTKLLHLNVELIEENYRGQNIELPVIKGMLKYYGYQYPDPFFSALEKNTLALPDSTRDIYLYLPSNLSSIMPHIIKFASLDLEKGIEKEVPLFYMSKHYTVKRDLLILGNHAMVINLKKGTIKQGDYDIPLHKFVILDKKNNTLTKQISKVNKNSPFCVIMDKVHKEYFVVDTSFFYSTYVQLGLLENYDPNYYEPVLLHDLAKVYKLKNKL